MIDAIYEAFRTAELGACEAPHQHYHFPVRGGDSAPILTPALLMALIDMYREAQSEKWRTGTVGTIHLDAAISRVEALARPSSGEQR